MTPLLVLCVGNPILGDDGLGPRVAEALAEDGGLPPGAVVECGFTGGLDLLPAVEGAERLILVDAVDIGERPGAVLCFDSPDIPMGFGRPISPHQVAVSDVLALARLRGTAPKRLALVGVQVERVGLGLELTPAVAAAVPHACAVVRSEARRLLAGTNGDAP